MSSSLALAQDHLEPNSNIFEDYDFQYQYYSQIRDLLFEGLSDQPISQLIILPSFSKELVWQIDNNQKDNKYYSITSTANHSIWYNQYEDKPKKLKQEISRNEITKESAELIRKLFLVALKGVKYSDDRQGLDGTNYYFSVTEMGSKSGTIWSPRKGSKMRELVDLSQRVIGETQKQSNLSKSLIKDINKLISELNNAH
ncbi:MAG: hypothetical protein HEP71_01280 [Roseivirga sp.]|nr:hypothetical protein [Roseivirga sp.]